jgi:CheY-like chemotaxis protein
MTATILVIEDNEDNMRLVDYVLRAHGYEPLLATNGAEGLRSALECRPDLILLDIRMPQMDGYEVAARIKQADLQTTKVVAVTASAMVGDRERISAAGFDGYIQKPIEPETFMADIERFLPARPR